MASTRTPRIPFSASGPSSLGPSAQEQKSDLVAVKSGEQLLRRRGVRHVANQSDLRAKMALVDGPDQALTRVYLRSLDASTRMNWAASGHQQSIHCTVAMQSSMQLISGDDLVAEGSRFERTSRNEAMQGWCDR